MMFPVNVRRYGSVAELPRRQRLCAGPLTLALEEGDLRDIRLGEQLVLRRVYLAVRDRNWGTIAPTFSDWRIETADDSFRVRFEAAHKQGEIDFVWRGEISGDTDGTLRYTMDGTAQSTFWRNRIGLCVLHPRECAGARARIEHADGPCQEALFPVRIDPHQPVEPFANLRAVTHRVDGTTWARVELHGEVFEMEDQRNWTDASFKIFGTPLALPFPVQILKGTRVVQSFTLSLNPAPAQPASRGSRGATQLVFGDKTFFVPHVGFGVGEGALTPRQVELLSACKPDHLRVDLELTTNYIGVLEHAVQQARALDKPLWVALLLEEEPRAQFDTLRAHLERLDPSIERWLVYPAREGTLGGANLETLVNTTRVALRSYDENIPFAAGSNGDYILFARNAPPTWNTDAVTFAVNPQTHAFDNASLIETLAAQADVIASARALAQGRRVIVSPITLKPRKNFYSTAPAAPRLPDELPRNVDVRQMSLFGAVWTAGSLLQVTQAGAYAATYFETTGWRGLMQDETDAERPDLFFARAGMVFPLYHIFADVFEFTNVSLVECSSSQSECVQGLLLRGLAHSRNRRLLILNMTNVLQSVRVPELKGELVLRRLNEETFEQAVMEPGTFRASGVSITAQEGLKWELLPYETLTVDWMEGAQ